MFAGEDHHGQLSEDELPAEAAHGGGNDAAGQPEESGCVLHSDGEGSGGGQQQCKTQSLLQSLTLPAAAAGHSAAAASPPPPPCC